MLRKYEECLSDCLKALELDPKLYKVYSRAFQVYMILGDYKNAENIVTVFIYLYFINN